MILRTCTFILLTCTAHLCFSEQPRDVTLQLPQGLQIQGLEKSDAATVLSAYLQGMIDTQFPESGVRVRVAEKRVILENIAASNQGDQIVQFVQAVTKEPQTDFGAQERVSGTWFPESTLLFPTQLADPARVCFAGGIRLGDSVAGQVSTPVTFGDHLPVYRWHNVKLYNATGELQVGIEGAIFSIFNQTDYSSPLINADYYVGVPLSFATGRWAHRLRIYHVSSHLGDEYMNRPHHKTRVNKSYEAIDIFTSYYLTKQIRLYAGLGTIPHSDSEMHLKKLYVQYGLEVHVAKKEWQELYGCPYIAMHFENWQDCQYKINANFAIGYEWGKLSGLGRKFRIALEYHNGTCCDGQFSRTASDYIQARFSWGF